MSKEEKEFLDEYERRKVNMRPDALVIPKDVLTLLRIPKTPIRKGTVTKEEWTEQEKSKAQECINRAKNTLYPNELVESVPLVFHQQVADRITALAAIYYSVPDEKRIRLLEAIISNSQISARTNYQFVRHFIRRSFYPILRAKNIDIPEKWEQSLCVIPEKDLSPTTKTKWHDLWAYLEKSLEELGASFSMSVKKGFEAGVETTTKFFIVGSAIALAGYIAHIKLEGMGFSVKEIVELIIEIAKGEFEHYDEIKDVLKAIREADDSARIKVLKGSEKGWVYVSTGLRNRGIACSPWQPNLPRIRYYALPVSHMLLYTPTHCQDKNLGFLRWIHRRMLKQLERREPEGRPECQLLRRTPRLGCGSPKPGVIADYYTIQNTG